MIIISNIRKTSVFITNNLEEETKNSNISDPVDEKTIEVQDEKNVINREQIISQEINDEDKNTENLPKVNKTNIQKVIDIRINNSFAAASKKLKSDLEKNNS